MKMLKWQSDWDTFRSNYLIHFFQRFFFQRILIFLKNKISTKMSHKRLVFYEEIKVYTGHWKELLRKKHLISHKKYRTTVRITLQIRNEVQNLIESEDSMLLFDDVQDVIVCTWIQLKTIHNIISSQFNWILCISSFFFHDFCLRQLWLVHISFMW